MKDIMYCGMSNVLVIEIILNKWEIHYKIKVRVLNKKYFIIEF